jgi:hypothetical protein
MRAKLDKGGYRIGVTFALMAMGGLLALGWWIWPMMTSVPTAVVIGFYALTSINLVLLAVLIRLLHREHHQGD